MKVASGVRLSRRRPHADADLTAACAIFRAPARHALLATAFVMTLGGASTTHATTLAEAWTAASTHDAELIAAGAAREAGATRRAQSAALWRPTVVATGMAGAGWNDSSTSGAAFSAPGFGSATGVGFDTSIRHGSSGRWALEARQPLWNGERGAQARALDLAADAADLQWRDARQAAMLRTASRYLDAALADAAVTVARRQLDAVERARVEAADRHRLGDKPVTDVHEATARAEAVRAQLLLAETNAELARAALADLTGIAPERLAPHLPGTPAGRPTAAPSGASSLDATDSPGPLDHWLAEARDANPQLALAATAAEIARQDARARSAWASPSLDLVARTGRDRLAGNGDYGHSAVSATSSVIGVQLTVPLFTGGMRAAREAEALHLADKAEAEADNARQTIARATRAAWLGVTAGTGRVAALDAALTASRARLDATRTGLEVGDRTTLDLLDAENDAAAAELALLRARADLLLNRLNLQALAGRLDEPSIQAADRALQPAP
ncbi:TolC family protein [Derxia gummosa]|uniref:TolC family protein n=1 Tax=Derxia gummosa DSM 723 TaxID=1121388 RepID=A0A9U5G092_9BURK|nr:TolC family protein [Derxia gummosa]